MTHATADAAIINISCYKFVALDDLAARRDAIRLAAAEADLRGTVLLSSEGINLFVAGSRRGIDSFVAFLRTDPLLSDLQPKESLNAYQPFSRMLVKIKREIIAFGHDDVRPAVRTSPKLPAAELRRWLDEGRPVHLLDTRNDYEVQIGTFRNAVHLDIDHFREFPEAIQRLPQSMKDEPVVMFCTGGIRCEKAGPWMESAGFRNVYQLDGGILKYFEEVGGAHWDGECFVFDQRVAVDPQLRETGTTQCYICQAVVTQEQQRLPEYSAGQSCPACYRSPAQQQQQVLAQRAEQIIAIVDPLPGSRAELNRRPLNVPQRCAGMTLLDFLLSLHPQTGREEWQRRISSAEVVPAEPGRGRRARRSPESLPLAAERQVREGERFDLLEPHVVEPPVTASLQVLYEDAELIVICKPAPLPVHACGRFHRNTLRHILNLVYFPERPHVVHRLDANTSGVMVLARRKRTATLLSRQFEQREVLKTYVARVTGHPASDSFRCELSLGAEPGAGGLRLPDSEGDEAVTDFRVLRRLPDGTALVEAVPVTGRTGQIRVHLWSLGYPICGDPAWLPGGVTGENRTLDPAEPPLYLHAETLQFRGPAGELLSFSAPLPDWANG